MKYFLLREFDCKCCGANEMQTGTMIALDLARGEAKTTFYLNSAYRCEKHNKEIGGSPTSSHMKGYAVDIMANTSSDRFAIVSSLLGVGFNRIGVYKNFIHVDNCPDKIPNVMWYK